MIITRARKNMSFVAACVGGYVNVYICECVCVCMCVCVSVFQEMCVRVMSCEASLQGSGSSRRSV